VTNYEGEEVLPHAENFLPSAGGSRCMPIFLWYFIRMNLRVWRQA